MPLWIFQVQHPPHPREGTALIVEEVTLTPFGLQLVLRWPGGGTQGQDLYLWVVLRFAYEVREYVEPAD